MKPEELAKAKDKDLLYSLEAMKRAAASARRLAVQTGTAIVVCEGKKIVRRTAAELEAVKG